MYDAHLVHYVSQSAVLCYAVNLLDLSALCVSSPHENIPSSIQLLGGSTRKTILLICPSYFLFFFIIIISHYVLSFASIFFSFSCFRVPTNNKCNTV